VQIALILFPLVGIAYGSLLAKWHGELMALLREAHPATWQQLGSPHSAWGGWTWRTLKFLLGRRFENLYDPRFSAAARRFRLRFLIWVGGLTAVALFAVVLSSL
jgi:hypothetical protein